VIVAVARAARNVTARIVDAQIAKNEKCFSCLFDEKTNTTNFVLSTMVIIFLNYK
jgi:hypothetical protein